MSLVDSYHITESIMKKFLLLLWIPSLALYGNTMIGFESFDIMGGYDKGTGYKFENRQKVNCTRTINSDRYFFSCSTSISDADFYFMENEYLTCACPCRNSVGFGSPRKFYKAKGKGPLSDYWKPLNLNDSALFTRIDTVRQTEYEKSCCYIPYVKFPNGIHDSTQTFVMTTKIGRAILLHATANYVTETIKCSGGATYFTVTYLNSIGIEWCINNVPGNLDFSWVKNVSTLTDKRSGGRNGDTRFTPAKKPVTLGFYSKTVSEKSAIIYTLQGKKIDPERYKKKNSIIIFEWRNEDKNQAR
jgi:hypothetical protein